MKDRSLVCACLIFLFFAPIPQQPPDLKKEKKERKEKTKLPDPNLYAQGQHSDWHTKELNVEWTNECKQQWFFASPSEWFIFWGRDQ